MFHTFSYKDGVMFIATKAWSDFASHIPLIRSFSLGENFPPQYPLFPGPPIRYHFLFYFFVGLLEKTGLPIDLALNIPSAVGFFALLVSLYVFSNALFHSRFVGILTVLFFLFNGSLSFIYYFYKHPLSLNTINEIITNQTFPTFGPYDGNIVSAFWSLNIYTNQRHLAAAFSLSIFLIYSFIFILPHLKSYKRLLICLLFGLILGASFYFHLVVLLMSSLVLFILGVFTKKIKEVFIILVTTALVAFPQYLYLTSETSSYALTFRLGYLIFDRLTVSSFLSYWYANFGLHMILIPIGFFLARRNQQVIITAAFSSFIIGNIFQFSPDIAGNHKFFNYFMLFGVMYSSFALVVLWKKIIFRPFIVIAVFFLLLSGIIDFFPVKNDPTIQLLDYPKNADIAWVMNNTSPSSVFLNSNYLYDAASLAGRKIFLGWPYFAWSQGYNTPKRSVDVKVFFQEKNPKTLCEFLLNHNIDYVLLTSSSEDFPYDEIFWKTTFEAVYQNPKSDVIIYSFKTICQKQL